MAQPRNMKWKLHLCVSNMPVHAKTYKYDASYIDIFKSNSNRQSGNIEDIKIPEEKPPLTLLSERLDINLGEKNIKTKTKLVVLIGKLRSTFQGPDVCAKGLLIYDLRSTKKWWNNCLGRHHCTLT